MNGGPLLELDGITRRFGRVTVADPVPGRIGFCEPVLGKVLGSAAVTGEQLRQPDHLSLLTHDEFGELAESVLSGHRAAL